ncbi:nicotinate-nucleotide--dimethylbenzimidazole phosphoribosyltransferase [Burkholderiales bacterium]|nr:MAG: nicotinate-nucleotide--dimethylbenzimidazole phosphoribosyltransferase [Burkholderiales bacterium]CAG1007518.1 nicotinate-nucleotide--dimethylbenzimidazole phosphoribosyltransferase [Burkholderiales bacterium]
MAHAWLKNPPRAVDHLAAEAARERQSQLTKPPGALGELERLAIRLAGLQGRERPQAGNVWISVFAGDHGVAEEGVSAFPQAVTAEMIKNFARGGAAISVLARHLAATLEVIDLGTAGGLDGVPGVRHVALGRGSANLARTAAMSESQLAGALLEGRAAALRALSARAEVFIGGEMGIANTTAATALACALLHEKPARLAGPGTGLDASGVAHKCQVIASALDLHGSALHEPSEALRRVGGFEIAALAGAYVACAQEGLPVLVDGFIASSAALAAERLCPGVGEFFLFSHASAEPGHARLIEALRGRPLLSLDLRLGEGSGAAVALPLLRLACALHGGMATFAEAAVSTKL